MGLTDIVRKVQEEANLESERLMTASKEEIRKLREASQSELRSRLEELKGKLEKEKRALWNMYVSDGMRKSRHTILCTKEELIRGTISALRGRLTEMRGPEMTSKLDILLEKAMEALGADLKVYPARSIDAESIKGKVPMGEVLEGARDLPGVISRFQGKDHLGGFVAVSSNGNKVLDMTFHGLMEKNEEHIREEISRTLFGE